MRGILIGAMHKDGEFTDDNGNKLKYNNLVLILQKPIEQVDSPDRLVQGVGFTTTEAKCPWNNLTDVFGGKIKDLKQIGELVGSEVQYFYDDKKRLDTVIF